MKLFKLTPNDNFLASFVNEIIVVADSKEEALETILDNYKEWKEIRKGIFDALIQEIKLEDFIKPEIIAINVC